MADRRKLSNNELGEHGEDAATKFLTESGLEILDRNWRCRYGELDIVAREGDTTVFVEVKTRSGGYFGTPAEAVTPLKQRRIRRLAGLWLVQQRGPWSAVRFDVVSVEFEPDGTPSMWHLPGVF